MHRRTFLHTLPFLAASTGVLARDRYTRFPATVAYSASTSFPPEKRIPIGLKGFPVPVEQSEGPPTLLRFGNSLRTRPDSVGTRLRLTAAIDFREHKVVEAYLPDTGEVVGRLDLRYAYPFQPFEVELAAAHLPAIARQGLALRQTQGVKVPWFLHGEALPTDAAALAPQLISGRRGDERTFHRALWSMNSFSPFGWMGGCVLDALYEDMQRGNPYAGRTLRTHLGHYLDDTVGIRFENPVTQPLEGQYNSIEDFLPLAAIVALYPEHPAVQLAVDFMLAHRNEEGLILNGHVTTEGCYTVAYPLAAIALHRGDATLAQVALDQVRLRAGRLVSDEAVYQRASLDGERSYRNWGRGVAWYLLGTIKTLVLLEQSSLKVTGLTEVRTTWQRTADWVREYANRDQVYYAFLDRPETEVDASASAGIAAALAWAGDRRTGRRTYRSLLQYLTPDGLLGQVTQINRGGEDLQEGGYRVIAQFGMGLLEQLRIAAAET